ncbi:MAG: DUF4198 domain-containing protein [Thermodesulfovibrionales bacterium]|nr:DUF4198 domain-containing protein [Thermodesulfovibrionales bacterium]
MRKFRKYLFAFMVSVIVVFGAHEARAHFAMLLPSDDIVTIKDEKKITLRAWLIHPFEQTVLTMKKPESLGVRVRGVDTDLLERLQKAEVPDGSAYYLAYPIKKPGDHIFHMKSAPYFDANETLFIVQYAKVVVSALGRSGGWEEPIGMEAEIVPLTRPYGLWVGNVFQGRVIFRGKPMPGVKVDVEHYNADGSLKAPSSAYVTQTVLTDSEGVFTYAIPRKGWWGFAALFLSGDTMVLKGKGYAVEHGAIFWVNALEIP